MNEKQAKKAVKALFEYTKKKELTENFQLVVSKEIPKKQCTKPKSIKIRNPTEKSILLIHKDGIDIKDLAAELNIKSMSIKKLKKLTTYEQKRALCDEYELFLSDSRVVELLPKLIGKSFFLKKKQPYVVDVKKIVAEVENVRNSTLFYQSKGSCR